MNDLLSRMTNLILKLVKDLEKDIGNNLINLKDKKLFTDLVSKLLPLIIKLREVDIATESHGISDEDLKIIDHFLKRQHKLVAREGFEPPTNGL